jgi:tetratricopeptide (TPR) repeat protein
MGKTKDSPGETPLAWFLEVTVSRQLFLLGCCLLVGLVGCKPKDKNALLVARETFAELRVVKGQVSITEAGKRARTPYPRERLGEGAELLLEAESLASMRDDHGATWLLAGPAQAKVTKTAVQLMAGKAFVDTQGGPAVSLGTPGGTVEVSEGRSSVTAGTNRAVEAYVLRGSLRHGALRANAGEMLTLRDGQAPHIGRIASWTDWTSGLATADPEPQPAPYGIGTVGARSAGDQGKPRFSLVIQRLDVRVVIDHDFARTEVDETFVNPSSGDVEGLFGFRVPENAVLHQFGVDRDGLLVWGKPEEKRSAAAQYQSNVYAGSTEDPALLEWVQRGVYQARLYPIGAGTSRRVVTRYGEWLARSGEHGERRLYVYPMAATGAEGTLPRIEEMTIRVDWSRAHASRIRAPVGTVLQGKQLIVKAFDLLPKSDLAVELFDAGQSEILAYRAKHALSKSDVPVGAAEDFASKTSAEEPDYVLLPLTPPKAEQVEPGLDLAIVVDSSAANESSAMAVSRSLVDALLAALGPTDRAALFTGDTTLRPVAAESQQLTRLDELRKKAWLAELANAPLGGASDIGTLLAEAAERLEPKRRGAVIYIGDGRPSVGELLPKALHDRLNRLPPTARIFAVGVGSQVNRVLLESLVRGAPLENVQNGYEAAQAALRLLEAANSPAWQNVTLRFAGVDRLLPRSVPVVAAGEPALLVGRVAGPIIGERLEITDAAGTHSIPIRVVALNDDGDLRRRWGEGRLGELLEQHTGRLAIVDLARRYGLLTPWTSLYVATRKEIEAQTHHAIAASDLTPEQQREAQAERLARWRPWNAFGGLFVMRAASPPYAEEVAAVAQPMASSADNKEGGTGTRAKGEEGSMGSPMAKASGRRYAVRGPTDNPDPHAARAAALKEAEEFGMVGLLDNAKKGRADPNAPAAPWGRDTSAGTGEPEPAPAAATADVPTGATDEIANANGLKPGSAGGGKVPRGEGIGLGAVGAGLGLSNTGDVRIAERQQERRKAPARPAGDAIRGDPLASPSMPPSEATAEKQTASAVTRSGFGSGHGRLGGSHSTAAPKAGEEDGRTASTSLATVAAEKRPIRPGTIVAAMPPIAQLTHQLAPCSPASDLPLAERRKLWRERLGGCSTVEAVREVYTSAVRGCEAPGWYERQLLLYAMVDQLSSVKERVRLYQSLLASPTTAEVVYRAILVRINDAAALREFHEALGIKSATPELVDGLMRRANSMADRVRLLRGLVAQWPNDFELMLHLLEAYEDTGEIAGARSLARKLRRRADATSHVRTLVGEFYFRCAGRAGEKNQGLDLEEARRAFGEIVEFAPEDPAARRRLGDLLRAHGWYDEALRQYETLRELLPDDPTVHLLVAAAAQGTGKLEEALRWSEKAAATAAPDGQSDLERAAQAISAAFLAWAGEDAKKAGRQADAERLLLRGRKLAADPAESEGRIRFILTWEHPELRPTLYGLTGSGPVLGRQMSLLGVAEQLASKQESRVEVRLDPDDVKRVARLGAEVVLTAIVADGTPEQSSTRTRLRFGDVAHPKPTIRLAYANGALQEEAF